MADDDLRHSLDEGQEEAPEESVGRTISVTVADADQAPSDMKPAQGESQDGALSMSENALRVLKRRYLKRDTEGNVTEMPQEMFRRVAQNIAQADLKYNPEADVLELEQEFYDAMTSLEFLPNSPTLMNAGRELQQLSACFVLPIEDSMDSIFEAVKNTALIHKTGGGTGFSFSRIRPIDDVVLSTKGVSSGPISFMSVFNAATETIKQGGTRRGANMAILRVDHPDILDFISCKEDNDTLTNFNISVGITEKFMQAVEYDKEYELINPRVEEVHKFQKKLRAKEVFEKIVEHAWLNGEPGIVFLDRLNKDNPTPKIGDIESTNPCGEQPLLPYESCNLGSLNLSVMVKPNETGHEIDWERLARTVKTAVHFLDNVIDVNEYPLPEIEKMTKANRKIGLGVMGFADMLADLRIPYDSEKGVDIAEKVMHFIQDQGRKASVEMAKERGLFPNFKDSIYDVYDGPRLRNATVTTIAPTGTISIIGDASPGVEPYFALAFTRNVLDNERLVTVNRHFEEMAKEEGFHSEELMQQIANSGSVKDNEDVPSWVQRIFVTAHDIAPEWHVKMQAAFQKFTDNAVSKTVNFPNHATKENVQRVYLLAYHSGCKGVTIYRDGSRDAQVISTGKTAEANAASMALISELEDRQVSPRKRPIVTNGTTERMRTGCGYLYVTINEDEDGLCELFTQMGKGGGCAASNSEAVSRLCSLTLRSGVDPHSIIKQLKGIRCPSPGMDGTGVVRSCSDAVAKALERYVDRREDRLRREAEERAIEAEVDRGMAEMVDKLSRQATVTTTIQPPRETDGNCPECPECGSLIEYAEGCIVCRGCGYSKCG